MEHIKRRDHIAIQNIRLFREHIVHLIPGQIQPLCNGFYAENGKFKSGFIHAFGPG